ncbi:unnamed protein product [Vicia faba]|uniref:Uncharacterized protein n=1 Tax=Vicia faba TaxID=3906 RepID=A0AAV1A220_VICFA|nr:unnamed protein product [Vicia faba]
MNHMKISEKRNLSDGDLMWIYGEPLLRASSMVCQGWWQSRQTRFAIRRFLSGTADGSRWSVSSYVCVRCIANLQSQMLLSKSKTRRHVNEIYVYRFYFFFLPFCKHNKKKTNNDCSVY